MRLAEETGLVKGINHELASMLLSIRMLNLPMPRRI